MLLYKTEAMCYNLNDVDIENDNENSKILQIFNNIFDEILDSISSKSFRN